MFCFIAPSTLILCTKQHKIAYQNLFRPVKILSKNEMQKSRPGAHSGAAFLIRSMSFYLVTVGPHKILTAQGRYKCAVTVPVCFDLHRGDCGGVAACKGKGGGEQYGKECFHVWFLLGCCCGFPRLPRLAAGYSFDRLPSGLRQAGCLRY
nr:MAG TPA: hypothetical protein [Caudoviricetes sp.]